MSLQLAAQHLSSQGRGPDDTLVHMSRNEVKSLNDLAMAHGGQLTINPQTGLPEAGFLSAILPMVAGAALNAAMPGSGMLVPALVGGASMILNPKAGLMGGLMAGLGAYGGQNLGEALAQQGMAQSGEIAAAKQAEAEAAKRLAEASQTAGFTNATGGLSQQAQSLLEAQQAANKTLIDAASAGRTNLANAGFMDRLGAMGQGVKTLGTGQGLTDLYTNLGSSPMSRVGTVASLAAPALTTQTAQPPAPVVDKDMGQRYTFSPNPSAPQPAPDVPTYDQMLTQQGNFGRQQNYFPNQGYTRVSPEQAKSIYGFAGGGPVEQMSTNATLGANTMYPMANMRTSSFATPYQAPQSINMLAPSGGGTVDQMSGEPNMQGTRLAAGGLSDLGGYSDGGRLLRGPGDGVSDSIPATIGHKQPARLADGEFVVPARIVSELGNGSTEAGARKLYAMMDRVQASRRNTIGKGKVAKNNRADRYLPA